jgi:hypothetical protein
MLTKNEYGNGNIEMWKKCYYFLSFSSFLIFLENITRSGVRKKDSWTNPTLHMILSSTVNKYSPHYHHACLSQQERAPQYLHLFKDDLKWSKKKPHLALTSYWMTLQLIIQARRAPHTAHSTAVLLLSKSNYAVLTSLSSVCLICNLHCSHISKCFFIVATSLSSALGWWKKQWWHTRGSVLETNITGGGGGKENIGHHWVHWPLAKI